MATKNSNKAAVARILYRILHSMVGNWQQGQIVDLEAEDLSPADIQRLVRIGAVRPVRPGEEAAESDSDGADTGDTEDDNDGGDDDENA